MAIGFLALLRQLFTVRSLLLLSLFFGGLAPLLFTSRVDNHRAFLLLIPITAWSAHGLSILFARLRGRWLAETHCALICLGATATLITNAWLHLGVYEPMDSNIALASDELDARLPTGASLVTAGLNCVAQATLDLKVAEAARVGQTRDGIMWGREVGNQLTDQRFTPESKEARDISASASRHPVLVLSALPVNSLTTWLKSSNLQVSESTTGQFSILEIKAP
jgi:hypothetical protein